MQWRSSLLGAFVCSSLFTAGCYATYEGDAEDVGEVASPQLDPSVKAWRLFTLTLGGDPLARALVIGGSNVGQYSAATEYWYVDTAALPALGTKKLVFSYTDGDSSPPSQSGGQTFALPRDVTWSSFTTDPVSGGSLYQNDNVYLRIAKSSSGLTRLTWYQVLPSGAVAVNIVPSGTFLPVSGPVSVPSGYAGRYIDQPIQ
ncbi:hypothetical protein WME89_31980 [Sorangium sp. So ce321]|uniref:hypothetical protein n=1 Tax=Sorangium sp. So ce321 TaxID=3133300 RepID=UPI003F6185C9